MQAYTIKRYSKQDKFQSSDTPKPQISANEVLVKIHASSLNQLDLKLKSGEFKLLLPYKFPLVLGHDFAGIVTEVGSNVQAFKIGDAVFGRPSTFHIGTFAEYIAVHTSDIALKPKNISFEEAASIPLVGLTAWQALVEMAKLKKGQKVFIQAGSGGVGTIAIQLAKHLESSVATTTSAANTDLVKRLGADVVIDYKSQDFSAVLTDYDVILNSQDEESLLKSLRILHQGGKAISISGPPDPAFANALHLPWFLKIALYFLSRKVITTAKKLGVDYAFLFMRANGSQLTEIAKLIENGAIQPVVDRIYPFDQLNEAAAYVSSGRAKGKVVINHESFL
jgi:alcohol dehydrogenase